MVSPNEQLEPTPFEPASAPEVRPEVSTALPGWVWPALGGLALLVLLVVFWLPGQFTPETPTSSAPAEQANPAPERTSPPPAAKAETGPDASPWSDAQAAKLRKEAQDVLAELLDLQFGLEERGAEQWAAQQYAEATALATGGDELYRQRQYPEAKASYEQSLELFRAINQSIPEVVNTLLDAATQAIEAGDKAEVERNLALAQLIEPENAQLAALQQRAANLAPLLALLEAAVQAEGTGDLAAAETSLREANTLDPAHQFTAAELQRVSAAYLAQRFNDAMSDGYAALDEGQYGKARQYFKSAAGLQGSSAEASSALQEVAAAEQGSKLTRLKSSGARLEQSEQWQQALEAYEQALAIDDNVTFATEGASRSRSRARLDKQFSTAIAEPQRLSDVAVAEAVEKLLAQARGIQPRGPKLEQQISRLDTLLRQANTVVNVNLVSDGETEVIVYKIARLGRFEQTQLKLRPGTYTARGSRNGYRDVLETFTITHQGQADAITIACRETIN